MTLHGSYEVPRYKKMVKQNSEEMIQDNKASSQLY